MKPESTTSVDISVTASSPSLGGSDSRSGAARGWRFWLIIVSLMMSTFIFALDAVAVGNALPSIVHDLTGTQFVWIGSAYSLAACAFLPMTGALSQAVGRRVVMLCALAFFAVGSALCGAAPSMNVLIVGRTIQGVGGGGIAALSQIILSDLVPLRERGAFSGFLAIAYTIASCIGPVVGGAFAQVGQWRWLFYFNIPLCCLNGALILICLKMKTPPGSMEKLKSIDWIGNALIISSTTSVVVGLTWGGVQFSWTSAKVLAPLILGLVGLCAFAVYEAMLANNPMVPIILMSNCTSLSGFIQSFLNQFTSSAIIYYLVVYYQACKGAGPIASGVDCFGLAFTAAPMAMVTGILVTKSAKYRPQIWVGWALTTLGCGLLSSLDAESSRAKGIGFQLLVGSGLGITYMGTYFPILAPLLVTENARAMALLVFLRNFAVVWGITIGGTVLQNGLQKNLPAEFTGQLTESTQIAYAVIPQISDLPQPLKDEVRRAFAASVRVIWQLLTGVSGMGFLVSLVMKGLPLHTSTDEEWSMQDGKDEKTKQTKDFDVYSAVDNV
ncbi:MFS general substrate transporter [Dentipellis sp. KUC8613]|nr:MFS general substrate transporter [Dentipellis sp. KUC8613]